MTHFSPSQLGDFAIWYLGFLISITFHEYAHALSAFRGGDRTAYHGGQLTLDPTPHIRRAPFGMVLIPVLTFFSSGWMMGWASTPYDPSWGRRYPKRQALMSLAGPLSNFALAFVALVILRVLLASGVFVPPAALSFSHLVSAPDSDSPGSILAALGMFLSIMLNLNILLGLFNLIPLPPLDGAGVVEGFGPKAVVRFYEMLANNSMAQIIGLLVAWKIFSYISGPAFSLVIKLVYPDLTYT
ncbi:MAG: site-2 protease family protein [Deltaproteobacteria bacterium]|nr:site-2 protease family protein [Deltaproteobacteria bacterium]